MLAAAETIRLDGRVAGTVRAGADILLTLGALLYLAGRSWLGRGEPAPE